MAIYLNKYNRMQQLVFILKANPDGLHKAEIARRLGVHRSTAGRYIDELSLTEQVWERDGLVGIDRENNTDNKNEYNIYEGAFMYHLVRLYQQEMNIKNPYASSAIRKIAGSFAKSSPVLSGNLFNAAELLDCADDIYSSSYIDNFEKLSEAWVNQKAAAVSYLHRVTGEGCNTVFETELFFTSKNSGGKTDMAVAGICRRTGELCRLKVADFSDVQYPVVNVDVEDGYQNMFCPISEFARNQRPYRIDENRQDLSVKEANHRIKNSLFMISSLVSIAFDDIEDEKVKEKVKRLRSRIDAVAGVHEQLTLNNGANRIPLDSFLGDLINRTIQLMSGPGSTIRKSIKIEHVSVYANVASPLGMIITELLINSFKHAKENNDFKISVLLRVREGKVIMRYNDGGPGFRLSSEGGNSGSELIRSFCRQLNCELKYKNNNIILEFKL